MLAGRGGDEEPQGNVVDTNLRMQSFSVLMFPWWLVVDADANLRGLFSGYSTAALQLATYEGRCYSYPTDRYEDSLQLRKVARATKHYKVTTVAMEHSVEGTLHYSATVATAATDLYVEVRTSPRFC